MGQEKIKWGNQRREAKEGKPEKGSQRRETKERKPKGEAKRANHTCSGSGDTALMLRGELAIPIANSMGIPQEM
jgi:hypothetical protein